MAFCLLVKIIFFLFSQVKLKYHEEIKKLKLELLAKDELLQKLSKECKELQNDLLKVQKKEEKTNGINNALISQQVIIIRRQIQK